MKFVALISGGKDSCYNILECLSEGHELVALANLYPTPQDGDEIDSHMYQSVGHEVIQSIAECIDNVPLFRAPISGKPLNVELRYDEPHQNDETEDLYNLLLEVKRAIPTVEAVSSGAILSNYQRTRVENICKRLNLTSLAYLWERNQNDLLDSMVYGGINSILIKVCSDGLTEKKHLGKSIKELLSQLKVLSEKYYLNTCGEGGEYESLTLDAPFYSHSIEIKKSQPVTLDSGYILDVKYLKIHEVELKKKSAGSYIDLQNINAEKIKEMYFKPSKFQTLTDELIDEISQNKRLTDTDCQSVKFVPNLFRIINVSVPIDAGLEWSVRRLFVEAERKLDSESLRLADVVYVTFFIDDMAQFKFINGIYDEYFNVTRPPRACVATGKGFLSLDLTVPNSTNQQWSTSQSSLMSIQSYSHWAPPAIGPYSQAAVYTSRLRALTDDQSETCEYQPITYTAFLSGQISLSPEHQILIHDGDMVSQFLLVLRHITRLISSQSPRRMFNWKCLQAMTCVCVRAEQLEQCRSMFHKLICEQDTVSDGNCDVCSHRVSWICLREGGRLPRNALVEVQTVFQFSETDGDADSAEVQYESPFFNADNFYGFN